MTTAILLLTAGLALLLAGANFLVDSAIAIARRAKISDFAIGIAVVGIGTSLPELFVSVSSAIQGMGDMAVGNVVGSNICNIFLILGITAIISPFAVTRQNMARDIPFGILVSVLLLLLCSDTLFPRIIRDEVGRLDGSRKTPLRASAANRQYCYGLWRQCRWQLCCMVATCSLTTL